MPATTAQHFLWVATELGNAAAQFNLGYMYANGEGVPEDDKEAVRWFRLTAEQGHAGAQSNLGSMYATGEGVTQDDISAHLWFSISEENGYEKAGNKISSDHCKFTKKSCYAGTIHTGSSINRLPIATA